MRKTFLFIFLLVTVERLDAATTVNDMWWSTSSPVMYGRTSTSDGYVMNHLYSAEARIYTDERSALTTSGWVTVSATATASLSITSSDLGSYALAGTHRVDCPYNYYDFYATTQNPEGITAGVSGVCYNLIEGTCYTDPYGAKKGNYQRMTPCSVKCTGVALMSDVASPPGSTYCLYSRKRYILWSSAQDGSFICYNSPPGAWWGVGACTSCSDTLVDCGCP